MKIKVFSHIVDLPGGFQITNEQIQMFFDCGLIHNAEFYLCVNYDINNYEWLIKIFKDINNVHILDNKALPHEFECPTLKVLKDTCDNVEEPFAALYIHHKGVRHLNNPAVLDWRKYMEYFNIEQWRICVNRLENGWDTVGVDWKQQPTLHYSGNFWWARSDYIKKLPTWTRPIDNGFNKQFPKLDESYADYRMECEFWLGLENPKAFEIYTTPHRNPYIEGYQRHYYRN
jgi:hypothetical protein